MTFFADFHIHSKYSRATAKNLDLEHLYIMAQIKGITVLGTGDFTHPGWWQEIQQKLEPAEEGLLRLKPEIARLCLCHHAPHHGGARRCRRLGFYKRRYGCNHRRNRFLRADGGT